MSRKFVSKRRPANGEHNKVTLFPFLAVLLCTMGALIMLLVVIARNVREQSGEQGVANPVAVTVSDQNPKLTGEQATEILEQIKMGTEEAEWFTENLSQSKKEAEETLTEKKTQLALAEKETQKVQDELERLAKLAEQLERHEKTSTEEVARLKLRLEQRKRQQQKEELELAEIQKQSAEEAKSYAIIPYRGTAGTYRRPIYIECCDGKVILQPEGVELTETDFLLTNRPDNPLDTALRVIRQYYIETNQIVRGTEPYPLLIVRPSGVEAYEATRRAVGTWIQEFGYELVEEDWKIEYPEPSEELKTRIEKQLEISRNRLAGYLAAMRAENMTARAQQYRLDHRGNVQPTNEMLPIPRNRQTGSTTSSATRSDRKAENRTNLNQQHELSNDPDVSLIARQENAANSPVPVEINNNINNIPQQNPTFGTQIIMAGKPESHSVPANQVYGSEYFKPSPPPQPPQQQGSPQFESAVTTSDRVASQAHSEQKNSEQPYSELPKNANAKQPAFPITGQGALPNRPENRSENRAENRSENRTENWALRDLVPFSTAVSRNIKIQCQANQYVLVPQAGLLGTRVVPAAGSVEETVDQLVAVIWEFMDSWGIAGEKMYWRPVLQVKVLPGGEQRFQELKYWLRNSGIAIVEL
ncbi:MAG: hypothetical protein LBQ50_08080 [Planctomycetaceae bacterium]|jgi:hypothetical protein|nr:hypothetical protein [Planctomycetaceae bacterium]